MKRLSFLVVGFVIVGCGGEGDADAIDEISEKYPEGKKVYDNSCVVCHQRDGKGLEGTYPPLAGSDYLLNDIDRSIEIILNGQSGEIEVNGNTYNSIMPAQQLTDQEVADVMNYVLNSWGNEGGEVELDQVKSAKHP